MKKNSIVMLLCLAFVLLLPVCAQADTAGTLVLPASLTAIEAESFRNDSSVQSVILPDGLVSIGSYAFAGSGVKCISFPASVRSIASNAFANCSSELTASAVPGSYAFNWCVEHGISVVQAITQGSTTASISTGDEVVRYSFIPAETGVYTLASTGSYDTRGYLYDASLTELANNDDGGEDSNFSISYTLEAGRIYYYDVRFYDSTTTGSFDLVLSKVVVQTITPGNITATISTGGDHLQYRFVPAVSGSYTLTSTGSYDTYGTLSDASFTELTHDDDSGENGNFSISYTLEAGRVYYYEVRFYSSSMTGSFVLNLNADFGPKITQQPSNVTAVIGDTVSFSVSATGTATLAYQWQEKLSTSSSWQNTSLSGNKTNTLRFTAKTAHNGRYFRCIVTDGNGFSITSNEVKLTVVSSADPIYRALLVGEESFDEVCTRNTGDVALMANMLASVEGPSGGTYSVTRKTDLNRTELKNAIASTFSDAKDNDVSLFFIATHGDADSEGIYAGSLALIGSGNESSILLNELASSLSAIPGKVIVILESCGSGAAVYANAADVNAADASRAEAFDEAFLDDVIRAFGAYDTEVVVNDPRSNTGEFRTSKFYVLTASDYLQLSWGTESGPYNYFTRWFTNGIGISGSMPADVQYAGNGDGRLTLEEAYQYVSAVGDNHEFNTSDGTYTQQVKRYPEGSAFQMFMR